MMNRWTHVVFSLALASMSGCAEAPTRPAGSAPLGIILLIGDGMGEGALAAARLRSGTLAIEQLPRRGSLATASSSSPITDSGAAATALATGVTTYNGAIGVGPDSLPRATVLEMAEERGMSTGLVTTSSITHATPAAFGAHVTSRSMQMEIARGLEGSGVDVLLGGGWRYFRSSTRPDSEDLIERLRSRGCVYGEAPEVLSRAVEASCLVGLFAGDGMPAITNGRAPTLAAMTTAALGVLLRDPDGFFLMVEGAQIDWAGHANDTERSISETLDFDAAVRAALQRVGHRPNTLIIITADHETGGLRVDGTSAETAQFRWTSTAHTAAPVPLFAIGPEAESLSGVPPIASVGDLLRGIVEER